MSDDVKAVDSEWVSEGFMQPSKKRITFLCARCGHQWTRTYRAEPKSDPACPAKGCAESHQLADLKKQVENLTRMLETQSAPPQIGANIKVRAIDATADIVMTDNKMTDLKDGIRMGETMAPKLPPVAQAAADNFFTAGAKAAAAIGDPAKIDTRKQNYIKRLGARAIAGDFRSSALSPNTVLPSQRPVAVTTSNPGYSPKKGSH